MDLGFRTLLSLILILSINKTAYAIEYANFGIGKAILKILFSTIIFVVIIIITVYGTKFIARKSNRFINSKYMKIIDVLSLGVNIKIILVEIGSNTYILTVNNNNVEFVDKIEKKDFEFDGDLGYKDEHSYDRYYIDRFQNKINELLGKPSKYIDKEDD